MAATDVIAELAVNLRLDSTAFARGSTVAAAKANTLEGRLKRFTKSSNIAGDAVKGLAAGFAGGVLAGGIAGLATGLAEATKRGLDQAASLGEVSQQLGVTSRDLQIYRYAASQVGIEQDAMDLGLQRLTKSLGQAAAGGKQAKVFAELGIDIHNANGSIKTAGEVIPQLADALARMPDAASRAAVEVALFGKSGQQLDTLLAGGSKGVNDLANAAERLGLVLSPEQIKKADDARDKLDALKQVIEAKIAGFAADNADTILKLANAAADFGTKALSAIDKIKSFESTFNGFVNAFIGSADKVHATAVRIGTAIQEGWNTAVASTQRMVGAIKSSLVGLTNILNAVAHPVQTVTNAFKTMYDKVVGHSYVPDMVTEIGAEMRRLDGVLVTPAQAATGKAAAAFRDLQQQTTGLLDRLFPDEAQANETAKGVQTLNEAFKQGIIDANTFYQAVQRAVTGTDGVSQELIDAAKPLDELKGGFDEFMAANDDVVVTAKKTGAEIAQAYGDMATNVLGSIRDMVGQLKSGDILGALQSVLSVVKSVVDTLVNVGVIHVGSTAGAAPRAQGGPVVPGRTYLVGERGPEYVRFGNRGYVQPSKGGGQARVQIVPSKYFDAVVDNRAAGVAAPMAGRAAIAGAAGGASSIYRRAARTLP